VGAAAGDAAAGGGREGVGVCVRGVGGAGWGEVGGGVTVVALIGRAVGGERLGGVRCNVRCMPEGGLSDAY